MLCLCSPPRHTINLITFFTIAWFEYVRTPVNETHINNEKFKVMTQCVTEAPEISLLQRSGEFQAELLNYP